MKAKKILITIAIVLVVVLTLGLVATLLLPDNVNPFKPDDKKEVAQVQYNPTFGGDFKEKTPISELTLRDNMPVAPYAYSDTTLFDGKRITRIDVPVGTVKAVDENQYFTLYVVKDTVVKAGGVYTSQPFKSYKIYLPKEELTDTTVNKWISVDVSDQFIYVAEDETLAFMNPTDPVICCYSNEAKYNFIYKLGESGMEQQKQSIYYGIFTDEMPDLSKKTISILGDSISTYSGISNNATDTNSTIGNNAIFYPSYEIDNSNETWWAQTAEATGMQVLVNNSWSGSRVLNGGGAAYDERCVQLHDNTGTNKGTNPDIIAVYMGINDFNANSELGSFNKLSEVYTEEEGYITPKTVAEAYAIMVHKMTEKYDTSDIFLFTLPANSSNKDTKTLGEYNEMIKDIAEYFDCYVVDIGNMEGYNYSTHTADGLHPNEIGMDLITDLFVRTLKGVYAPAEKA